MKCASWSSFLLDILCVKFPNYRVEFVLVHQSGAGMADWAEWALPLGGGPVISSTWDAVLLLTLAKFVPCLCWADDHVAVCLGWLTCMHGERYESEVVGSIYYVFWAVLGVYVLHGDSCAERSRGPSSTVCVCWCSRHVSGLPPVWTGSTRSRVVYGVHVPALAGGLTCALSTCII